MKNIGRYIARNWLWIVLGLVFTSLAVQAAYLKRGYVAYGGEWLTLPLILLLVEFVRDVAASVRAAFEAEEKYEQSGN